MQPCFKDTSFCAHSFLTAEAEADRFRGSVLLSRGHETFCSGFGLANEEWQVPNSPTTKFRIGSVTKNFTAAAILRLADAGHLDLNANVSTWLDDLPEAWRTLTPHQLLTHTSGLRDHISAPAKRTMNLIGARPEELTRLIAAEPLLYAPGTKRTYSNSGYLLLGMLIEKIAAEPYAQYLQNEILQPAGLNSTGYDSHAQILPERASGYSLTGGHLQDADYLNMTVPFSAGGLYSTVGDLLRWNTALHTQNVLNPVSYTRMTAEYPETEGPDGLYGYGLLLSKISRRLCYSHGGGVNGFISANVYCPELEASLVVLSNLFDPLAFQPIFNRLCDLLLAG